MKSKLAVKPEPTLPIAEAPRVPEKSVQTAKTAAPPLNLRRILVPLDFSDCSLHALDYALALAELFAAKLILLHVVEPAVYAENYLFAAPAMNETDQKLVEGGRERLAELSRKRIDHRADAETLVRMGHAHSEIPDTAKAVGADMIVLGTHGYTGLKHVLLGSTAERVVRHAPCPVLTVRHHATAETA
jgi:nucleotide-binding universal stress UspA family protein